MTPEVMLAVVGVFAAVAMGIWAAGTLWLQQTAPEQRRIQALTQPAVSGLVLDIPRLTDTPDPALARLTRLVPKSPKDMGQLQRRLTRAGYPQLRAAVYFSIAEIVIPFVLVVIAFLALGLTNGWLPALFLGFVGYFTPSLWLGRKTALRQKKIRNGLPDALDLLTVCVEAGSGLDQALAKASEELQLAHPALAEELRTIIVEIRAGKPRMEAFHNFAKRTGVEDVRTLVSMLTQTDRFGTSVADALRVQADTSRTKRRQAAEERAGKVGVKLVFPLALCLFPALYTVCFGPVVVAIYRAFFEGQ
jgi:tight adherence protein C